MTVFARLFLRARAAHPTKRLSRTLASPGKPLGLRVLGVRMYSAITRRPPRTAPIPAAFHTSATTSSSTFVSSDLPDNAYHREADRVMEQLLEYLEDIGDETDLPGYDVTYSSGVLTLRLGNKGTYVVNKQPPNRQIWLSSPVSGPKRYDYDEEHQRWFYGHDQSTLDDLLNEELSDALESSITVPIHGA